MAKSRRAKKRNGHKSQVDEDPGPDISLLSRPSATSVKGIRDVMKAFEEGTHEVHHLLSNECEILYECRVCRSLYRSFLNFITHKRIYCQQQYTSGSPKVNHFFNDVLDEDETLIVHDESGRLTRQSNGDVYRAEVDPVPSTSSSKAKAAPRKNLMEILGLLSQKASSSEGLKRVVNLDGFAAMSASNVGNETTGFNGRMPRQHLLHLESMESTDVAIRQTVTLGPDGKIISDADAGDASGDDDAKSSLHTNIENETETDFSCEKCNLTFSSRKTYRHHVSYMHDPSRVLFVCPICKNKFANTWSVHRHMKSIHNKNTNQLRRLRDQIQKVVRKVSNEPATNSTRSTPSARAKQQIYIKKQMELELFEKETKQCSGCSRKFDRLAAFNYHVANCVKRLVALKNVNEPNASADRPAPFIVSSSLNAKPKILSRSSQNLAVASAASTDEVSEMVAPKQDQPCLVVTVEPQDRRNSDKRSEHPVTKKIEIQLRRDYNKIALGPITPTTELSELINPEPQEVVDKPIQPIALSRVDYNKIVPRTVLEVELVEDDNEVIIISEVCHIEPSGCDEFIKVTEEIPVEGEILGLTSNIGCILEANILPPKEHEVAIENILSSAAQESEQNVSELQDDQLDNDYKLDERERQQFNNNIPGIKLLLPEVDASIEMIDDGGATRSVLIGGERKVDVSSSTGNHLPDISTNSDADSVLVPIHAKLKDITICKIVKNTADDGVPQKSILEGILTKIKTDVTAVTSVSNSSVLSKCVNMDGTSSLVNKSKRKKSFVKRASIMDWNGFEEQQTATVHSLESERKRFKADDVELSIPVTSDDGNTSQQDMCQEENCISDPKLYNVTSPNCQVESASTENCLNETYPVKESETAVQTQASLCSSENLQADGKAVIVEGVTSSHEIVAPQVDTEDHTPTPQKDDDSEIDISNYVECTLIEPANDDCTLSEPDSDKANNDEREVLRYNIPSKADVDEDILKVIFEEDDLSQTSSLHHKKGTIIMGNGTFSLGPCTPIERMEQAEESVNYKTSLVEDKVTESPETAAVSPLLIEGLTSPLATCSTPSSAMQTESRSSSSLNNERRLSADRSTSSSDTEQRPLSAEGTFSSFTESVAPRSRPFRNRAKVKNADFIYDVSDKSVFSLKSGDDHSTARHKSGSKASAKQTAENALELLGKDGNMSSSMNPTVKLYKCSEDNNFLNVGTKQNSNAKPSAPGEGQANSNPTGFSTTVRKSVRAVTK